MNFPALMRDLTGAKPSKFRPFKISTALAIAFASDPLPFQRDRDVTSHETVPASRQVVRHLLAVKRLKDAAWAADITSRPSLVEHDTRQRVDNARIFNDLRKAA